MGETYVGRLLRKKRYSMIEVCAIFAIGPDNVIGIEDKMPWHSRQDFYHYKKTTMGYPCLFGDRTFFWFYLNTHKQVVIILYVIQNIKLKLSIQKTGNILKYLLLKERY